MALAVRQLGGVARTDALLQAGSRADLRRAVAEGTVVRLGRGVYGLPEAVSHAAEAVRLDAALALESAALAHGWGVKLPPARPQLLVPRTRRVDPERREGVDLRWGEVSRAELDAGRTEPVRTAVDCARLLPFDSALAVVDSALRAGISRTDLLRACVRSPRTGRSRAYEVIELGDRTAANPFESVLRAVVGPIPGAAFVPQVWIGSVGRADLVDRARRIALEADSFEFHASSVAFAKDMERYNGFVAEGYDVLRFAWRHVMFEQTYVREAVTALVRPQRHAVRPCRGCSAA